MNICRARYKVLITEARPSGLKFQGFPEFPLIPSGQIFMNLGISLKLFIATYTSGINDFDLPINIWIMGIWSTYIYNIYIYHIYIQHHIYIHTYPPNDSMTAAGGPFDCGRWIFGSPGCAALAREAQGAQGEGRHWTTG